MSHDHDRKSGAQLRFARKSGAAKVRSIGLKNSGVGEASLQARLLRTLGCAANKAVEESGKLNVAQQKARSGGAGAAKVAPASGCAAKRALRAH
jgi:hypothetical protein